MIKSRRMRWAEHIERMREINTYNILVGRLESKNHSEDLDVDGGILLKWILGN
jgi:hypothetical protein